MSSKDVVVVVKLEEVDTSVASLDILLISTAGAKDVKTYTDPEDIAKDYTAESAVYKKAKVMMGQGKAKPTPASLIKKVKVVGFAEPESPEALVNAIKTFQDKDNDWYMFLTDQHEDAYIKALAAFAADSEPSEAELTAGVEDHRKFYFAETDNKELKLTDRRTVVIYTGNLDEQAEAAWIGSVGPWYPQSVTWKFKMPVGVNWVTNEYKKNYIKNGCCADGEWIDTILGGDWIAKKMREKLYNIFTSNETIPYTDAGFTIVAAGVFETLDQAADYGIIATDPESGAGVYNVSVPKRSAATDQQAALRQMPDIPWEAQLAGAVHGVKISGTLKVTLN